MPKPVTHTFTGSVGAPIDKVFALMTDPSRIPDWLPGCTAVAPKDGAMQPGARFHLEMGRHNIRVEVEIVDYSPPRTVGWIEHRRRAGSKVYFKLDYDGGATRVTMRHIWQPLGFRSWLLGQIRRRRNAARMFNGMLQNLRKALLK